MSLSKENYNRGKVLFSAISEKEKYATFLFKNKDTFPLAAIHIINMIDRDRGPTNLTQYGLFAGYIDILAHRRRTHPLYTDYKQHMNNHLMFLFLRERSRKQFHAIVILKIFIKRHVSRFIEWFYNPDTGSFMRNKIKTWLISV